jgi:ergothioneine biosynthesis protein EgtB
LDPLPDWPDFNAIPADQYPGHRDALVHAYRAVRAHSRNLSRRFSESEQQIQSMPDASPTKWHLAHTTWFFETFILILQNFSSDFKWFDRHFCYLFNSYYNAIGEQFPRPRRGLISQPDLKDVLIYRERIDEHMMQLLEVCDEDLFTNLSPALVLGLNHEQQHQELILTDIKHALYQSAHEDQRFVAAQNITELNRLKWIENSGGRSGMGYSGEGFCFDNELAVHEVLLPPFQISDHPVTSGEWLEFIGDDGYQQPLLWLSDGWQWKQQNQVQAPLYWRRIDRVWCSFTLDGWRAINPNDAVVHISYYEADAFAQWYGARLPRESEWEFAIAGQNGDSPADPGACWEWTQSAYSAYPGFKPTPGAAGEYNGKFMVNQMVLRGSSPATAMHHSRASYRNFFYPQARWQFSGMRLAEDF